jgi:hypothetical protein
MGVRVGVSEVAEARLYVCFKVAFTGFFQPIFTVKTTVCVISMDHVCELTIFHFRTVP